MVAWEDEGCGVVGAVDVRAAGVGVVFVGVGVGGGVEVDMLVVEI